MSQYFPKPFRSFGENINVKVDMSNYATKADIKNIAHVDTSSFALKTNLANLETEVVKLDIDKLAPVPVDLSKLSVAVKSDVVKKTVYDKLVAKINNIDTSGFVLKTNDNTDKTELENKILDVSNFVKKAKLIETENKISDVSSLATKTALTAVVVKNQTLTLKLQKLKINLLTIIMKNILQANLITKTDFEAKLWRINRKITENKTENVLIKNELNKLKKFDSSYIVGKSHFEEDGTQNYLVFQPLNKYFKVITNTDYVSSWKSIGLSGESIKQPTTSDNSLTPALNYYGTKTRVKFTGSCLKTTKSFIYSCSK